MSHYVMQVTVLYDVAPCSLVYVCVCIYIYIYLCVCVCVCVCVSDLNSLPPEGRQQFAAYLPICTVAMVRICFVA